MDEEEKLNLVEAQELLDIYKDDLNTFYTALSFTHFGKPDPNGDYNNNIISYFRLAAIQALVDIAKKRPESALEIGTYLIQLGYKYEHINATLLDCAIGTVIKSLGADIITKILDMDISDELLSLARSAISDCLDTRQGYIDAFKLEYSAWSKILEDPLGYMNKTEFLLEEEDDIFSNAYMWLMLRLPIFYKLNKTKSIHMNYYREIIDYYSGKRTEYPEYKFNEPNLLSGNISGEMLLIALIPIRMERNPFEVEEKLSKLLKEIEDWR